MSAVAIGSAVAGGVASAAVGSALGGGGGGGGAAAAADPFSSQRMAYQELLGQLMTGHDSSGNKTPFGPSDPSYQWRFDQGQKALQAGIAKSGMLNSGNQEMALIDYGQNQASTEYANEFSRLSQLAGANIGSPAAAGQIIAGQSAAQQQTAGVVGSQIGQAVSGAVQNYPWGGSSGGAPGGNFTTEGSQAGSNGFGFQSGVSDPSYGVSYSAGGYFG